MKSTNAILCSLLALLLTAACASSPSYDYLAENAQREGVVVRASGLQYRVLKEGTGVRPGVRDSVTVHYRGKLTDGRVFDSSYQRGEPATFQLNRVIKGWTEGLSLMREGAKWVLFIPPELGYGSQGAGQMIGPNETLIFEVELLKVHR